MSTLDWTVLVAYVCAITTFGAWAGRGTRRVDEFFLAGRRMRWWAVGLSVMATQASAVTIIGTTGQGFTKGMSFLVVYFALPFAMVILCATLVPFFYRARVFTAYEYLERRFDGRTRTLTALLFLLCRGMSVGVTLYAPALVLSVLLGWPEPATILLMGSGTIAYVMYGGNRSVIWTDVVQMGVVWFGILLCFTIAIRQLPADVGLRDALALASSTGRLRVLDTNTSLSAPYTLWSGLFGGLFLMLSYFGCDQSQVQRYLSGSSLTQSRLSLLFTAVLKIPMQFVILLTGVLVFVFYHFHEAPLLWNPVEMRKVEQGAPAEVGALRAAFASAQAERQARAEEFARARHAGLAADPAAYLAAGQRLDAVRDQARALAERQSKTKAYNDTNYIFPTYILTQLPHGLVGLVIAVIFAAAMSALSGEISSLATASMIDFYRRFAPTAWRTGHVDSTGSEARELLVSRLLTGAWGLFACGIAMKAGQLGSAIEVVNKFGSFFYGSILGVFGLAVLTPAAGARGAFYGLFVGMATVAAVSRFTAVHFLWYNLIGAVTVFATGLLITAVAPAPARA